MGYGSAVALTKHSASKHKDITLRSPKDIHELRNWELDDSPHDRRDDTGDRNEINLCERRGNVDHQVVAGLLLERVDEEDQKDPKEA